MLTSKQQERKSKQRKIRNSEYYDMETTFDGLYAKSKDGKIFNHLMEIIESEENIKLAYRTVKKNSGSNTAGVDKRTIKDLMKLSEEEYVRLIRKQFSNYRPRPVRRVEIPKPNGKTRPLGIPTIVDRIVQQCVLQVMEPICEAKFSENSNGFRPNRSAETAIAQCMRIMQVQHLHYVVDLDIKGFFDNINHTKLIRLIHFVKVVLRNFPAIVHNKPLDFIAHSFLAGGAEVDFHPIGRVSDFLHNIGLFCFLYGQRGSVCGGAGFIAHRLSFP